MSEQPVFGERYRLLWRSMEKGRIGEVRNYAADRKGYRVVPVLLNDDLMNRVRMRFLMTSWDNGGPEIIVSEAYTALPLHFREAGIWHEMGHIHHEHLLKDEFSDQAQLRAARIAAIERGQVMQQETQADQFAIARIGKEPIIAFLMHLLETRAKGGQLGLNDFGRRELELRIEAIQAS